MGFDFPFPFFIPRGSPSVEFLTTDFFVPFFPRKKKTGSSPSQVPMGKGLFPIPPRVIGTVFLFDSSVLKRPHPWFCGSTPSFLFAFLRLVPVFRLDPYVGFSIRSGHFACFPHAPGIRAFPWDAHVEARWDIVLPPEAFPPFRLFFADFTIGNPSFLACDGGVLFVARHSVPLFDFRGGIFLCPFGLSVFPPLFFF